MVSILVSVGIAGLAGLIGSIFTAGSVEGWYSTLLRPSWNPPNWVFGPVWTFLYVLMGIAASMVWTKRNIPLARTALWVYGAQLVLNALWSIAFFGLQSPSLALAEIVVLLAAIGLTTTLFWRVSPRAGMLLLPYLAWVAFATCLTFSIWQLN